MEVAYSPKFLRKLKSLDPDFREEIIEKIELLKDSKNYKSLKVHKLHGHFKNCYSFYVNYKTRIVFEYVSKKEVVLLAIGDHEVYKK
jgi:addiction module RelE/StbE family toxin